jgi:hypothetical protein
MTILATCIVLLLLNYGLVLALGLWVGSAIWVGVVAIWFKRAEGRRLNNGPFGKETPP